MTLQRLFKRTFVGLLGLSTGLGLFTSCGNNGCEENRESYLQATFKATGRISLSKVNVWCLTQNGDSLMTTASNPTELELSLHPDSSFTQIRLACTANDNGDYLQYDDTLSIAYTSYPYFIDMECGCSVYFEIQEATLTRHLFKSFTIKNNKITNEEKVNFAITY